MKFFDSIDVAGLEPLAVDPVTNVFVGRLYWNTANNEVRVYSGASWLPFSDGASTIDGLTDAAIAGAANNDFLSHNGTQWVNKNAATSRSSLGLGSIATVNSPVPIANGGTGGTDAGTARSNLGIGSAGQYNVVPIVYGGTGAADAATARTNLGLGAAAQLDYSTGSGTILWWSSPAGAAGYATYTYRKLGDMVTFRFHGMTAAWTNIAYFDTNGGGYLLPAAIRPNGSQALAFPLITYNNSVWQTSPGELTIHPSGRVGVIRSQASGFTTFQTGGVCGWACLSVAYLT